MKCPYCGGEVSAQSLKCPYCGRENAEGIAFQEEINRKIERNKLLKPLLIRQKTPELVQRMLTRIIIVVTIGNILVFALSFGIFMWTERDMKGSARPGTHAEAYMEEVHGDGNGYWYASFLGEANAFIEKIESGERPESSQAEVLAREAWYMIKEVAEYEPEKQEEASCYLKAFFTEYIGVSREDVAFLLEYDDAGGDSWRPPEQEVKTLAQAVRDRIKEKMP